MATTPPTRFSYSTFWNPASAIIDANFSCNPSITIHPVNAEKVTRQGFLDIQILNREVSAQFL